MPLIIASLHNTFVQDTASLGRSISRKNLVGKVRDETDVVCLLHIVCRTAARLELSNLHPRICLECTCEKVPTATLECGIDQVDNIDSCAACMNFTRLCANLRIQQIVQARSSEKLPIDTAQRQTHMEVQLPRSLTRLGVASKSLASKEATVSIGPLSGDSFPKIHCSLCAKF